MEIQNKVLLITGGTGSFNILDSNKIKNELLMINKITQKDIERIRSFYNLYVEKLIKEINSKVIYFLTAFKV